MLTLGGVNGRDQAFVKTDAFKDYEGDVATKPGLKTFRTHEF